MSRGTSLFALLLALAAPVFPAQKKPVTPDDVAPPPAGVSGSIVWAPSADRFAIAEEGMLAVYEVKSRKQRTAIALSKLESAAAKPVNGVQANEWVNRHVVEHSIQWFA